MWRDEFVCTRSRYTGVYEKYPGRLLCEKRCEAVIARHHDMHEMLAEDSKMQRRRRGARLRTANTSPIGCASLPRDQASVRSCEDALSPVGQEPRAALRTWQLVPRAVAAADMRMNPSEIAISADRVGKTLHKLLKTGGKSLKSTFKPAHPNAPNR